MFYCILFYLILSDLISYDLKKVRLPSLNMGSFGTKPVEKAHKALLSTFAEDVSKGAVDAANLKLAAEVAGGKLNPHKAASCMMVSLIEKHDRIARGCTARPNRTLKMIAPDGSKSKASDSSWINEIGFLLGNTARGSQRGKAFEAFGMNPRTSSAIKLDVPYLPKFFRAASYPDRLESNCTTVLQCENIVGSQWFTLTVDETVYTKVFDIIFNLEDTPGTWRDCCHHEYL